MDDWRGIESGTVDEVRAICEVIRDICPYITMLEMPGNHDADHTAWVSSDSWMIQIHGENRVVSMTASREREGVQEYSYLFEDPVSAVGWVLCRLGHGNNPGTYVATSFELTKRGKRTQMDVERELSDRQIEFYKEMFNQSQDSDDFGSW